MCRECVLKVSMRGVVCKLCVNCALINLCSRFRPERDTFDKRVKAIVRWFGEWDAVFKRLENTVIVETNKV